VAFEFEASNFAQVPFQFMTKAAPTYNELSIAPSLG